MKEFGKVAGYKINLQKFVAFPDNNKEIINNSKQTETLAKETEIISNDSVISELKPDYVIHGDNWKSGPTKAIRDNVEKLLSEYGGQIIDVPYTFNENGITEGQIQFVEDFK